jgi:hypothetical protein
MYPTDMQQLAKMCGGNMVFDANGGPVKVDNLDLMKFCTAINAYIRLDILRDIRDLETKPEVVAEIRKGASL